MSNLTDLTGLVAERFPSGTTTVAARMWAKVLALFTAVPSVAGLPTALGVCSGVGNNGSGNINVGGYGGNPPSAGDIVYSVVDPATATAYSTATGGIVAFISTVGAGPVVQQVSATNLSAVALLFYWYRPHP
jgi:hypothetical protein